MVKSILATETALSKATLSTLTGSIIPLSSILTYSPFAASNPVFSSLAFSTLFTTTPASNPAFSAICLKGALKALSTIAAPIASSPCRSSLILAFALISAAPPPITIPSSTAALVALKASSTRSFFSFISVSVAAPTLITATPPLNFASLSCNFSLS